MEIIILLNKTLSKEQKFIFKVHLFLPIILIILKHLPK